MDEKVARISSNKKSIKCIDDILKDQELKLQLMTKISWMVKKMKMKAVVGHKDEFIYLSQLMKYILPSLCSYELEKIQFCFKKLKTKTSFTEIQKSTNT